MHTRFKSGMTLLELPFVIGLLIIGMFVASWSARKIGWLGYPLGFLGAVLIIPALVCGIGALLFFIWPERPICRNGKCKTNDYELHRVEDKFEWFCNCGNQYRKSGRRFYEVRRDGSLAPYMVWSIFRGWFPDTEQRSGPTKR